MVKSEKTRRQKHRNAHRDFPLSCKMAGAFWCGESLAYLGLVRWRGPWPLVGLGAWMYWEPSRLPMLPPSCSVSSESTRIRSTVGGQYSYLLARLNNKLLDDCLYQITNETFGKRKMASKVVQQHHAVWGRMILEIVRANDDTKQGCICMHRI